MEHLTEALERLGVKTCPVCGKTGAKSLCLGCRSVSYCGKACQKVAWPSHKRECRRIVRERKKILDDAAAACAADEAIAADACRADIPEGAECYICGNDKYWKGDLVRGCSCRGPHAGFVHVRCLVANAEVKGSQGLQDDDYEFETALKHCSQCRQLHEGEVRVALNRASWLHFAGRAETDHWRQQALQNMALALQCAHQVVGREVKQFKMGLEARTGFRLSEAILINRNIVATSRRIHGPEDHRTITAEEALANVLRRVGDRENVDLALAMLERVYKWKVRNLGADDEETLSSAGFLADSMMDHGLSAKAEVLIRRTLPIKERKLGKLHSKVFWTRLQLIIILLRQGQQSKVDEAMAQHKALLPQAMRVLGPDHQVTLILSNPAFVRTYRSVRELDAAEKRELA